MDAPFVVSVPSAEIADALRPVPAGVEVIVWDLEGPAPRDTIDLLALPYMQPEMWSRLEPVRTRLVQGAAIGVDQVEPHLPPGRLFANASSVHETATAELAVALTLAAQRDIPVYVRNAEDGRWRPRLGEGLADRRVLLLGWGGVGKAIAARLAPFEVELTVVASRARHDDGQDVHGTDELPALLPEADIVILAIPGGSETRHTIDDDALSALPEGALVVNVGRGPAIDLDALVDHVRRGRIRAALDVTDPEPLPPDHPFWTLPGALVTPHVGGYTRAMLPRYVRLIRAQLERLRAGDEPLNVVFGG